MNVGSNAIAQFYGGGGYIKGGVKLHSTSYLTIYPSSALISDGVSSDFLEIDIGATLECKEHSRILAGRSSSHFTNNGNFIAHETSVFRVGGDASHNGIITCYGNIDFGSIYFSGLGSLILEAGSTFSCSGFIGTAGASMGAYYELKSDTPGNVAYFNINKVGHIFRLNVTDIDSSGGTHVVVENDCTIDISVINWDSTPYTDMNITSYDDLMEATKYASRSFTLTADIDFTGKPDFWGFGGSIFPFSYTGVFDGNGHTISNVNMFTHAHSSTITDFGFFNSLEGNNIIGDVTVKDLTLDNIAVTGGDNVGGLAGVFYGYYGDLTIQNVIVNGVVIGGFSSCGGLIGTINSGGTSIVIEGSSFNGQITGVYFSVTGGLIGEGYEFTITDCSADITLVAGDVINGGSDAGGLVGYGGTIIFEKCFSIGSITTYYEAGGLVSYGYDCNIHNCYSHCNITVTEECVVGGIFAYADGEVFIRNSYASGDILQTTNNGANVHIGGLVGEFYIYGSSSSDEFIENCYSAGVIILTGTPISSRIGSFIGYLSGTTITDQLSNCSHLIDSILNAVGYYHHTTLPVATLLGNSWGTDETDNTEFYSKNHTVYAQV